MSPTYLTGVPSEATADPLDAPFAESYAAYDAAVAARPRRPERRTVEVDAVHGPAISFDTEPPDSSVARQLGHRTCLSQGWMPWSADGGDLVVATVRAPDLHVRYVAHELFGAERVVIRPTTDADFRRALEQVHQTTLLYEAADRLAMRFPDLSARAGLALWQRWLPLVALVALVVGVVRQPIDGIVWLLAVSNLLFVTNIAFKSVAVTIMPFRQASRARRRLAEIRSRVARGMPPVWPGLPEDDADLPVYTVLVPAYHEANVVATLVRNLSALDYPTDKLDVMLLLEADDHETIAVATSMTLPEHVQIVIVPPGTPQTKPRACNYGLSLARGEYVVIYDAEDRPDPDQLKLAVSAFRRDHFEQRHGLSRRPPLAVVQASLHYFNADYNVLTRMFAIEYAHWFEAMLPGMGSTGLPLPLGGTSNHFDVALLRDIGSWDPYNVTEDADAGLRTAGAGFRVETIESSTGEEACAQTGAWIKQRTRWIKGYMMTAAVNLRNPWRFARRSGATGVISMLGLIAATPLAFLAYPLALTMTISTYIGVKFIGLHLPDWLITISTLTFVGGNVMMIITTGIVATSRYTWRIGIFAVFSPIYWLLHSVAAWRAIYQVIFDPHRWEKTAHGMTEDYESTAHI